MLSSAQKNSIVNPSKASEKPELENPADSKVTTSKSKDDELIIYTQKNIRRKLAMKQYSIKHLADKKLEEYPIFIVGNDPVIPTEELKPHCVQNSKIALIATSGMRAVYLACKLGSAKYTPKIILIDNSKTVNKFWYKLRELMLDAKEGATEESFLKQLPFFLKENETLYRHLSDDYYDADGRKEGIKYHNQNITSYFKELIKEFSYDYFRAVVLYSSLIKQSWTDPEIFIKIRNILQFNEISKIFTYPSNISGEIYNPKEIIQFFDNIASLKPLLTIHSDYSFRHQGRPENIILLQDNDQQHALQKVLLKRLETDKTIIASLRFFQPIVPLLEKAREDARVELEKRGRILKHDLASISQAPH
jgi:hypothetical protein